jgi:hypothetical protein
MEQLIIKVTNQEKARLLTEILSALDFVSSVEEITDHSSESEDDQDFFAMAGLWENKNITIDSIRQKAWKEEEK